MADHGSDHAHTIEMERLTFLYPTPPAFASNSDEPTAPDESGAGNTSKPAGFLVKLVYALICLFILLCAPLYIPFMIIYIFITGDTSLLSGKDYDGVPSDGEKKKGSIKSKKPAMEVEVHHLTIVMLVRMGCLVSIWMVINLSVPSLKRAPLLGSRLWKWTFLANLALLGYPIIFLLYVFAYGLRSVPFTAFRGSNVEYCVVGLAQSANLVLYFTTILVVWLLCVDTSNASLRKYGSMTLASFLVGAVLSVAKSVVLLWWKTKLIYKKYEGKILSAGSQLYIYLLIAEENDVLMGCRQLVAWGESTDYKLEPSVVDNISGEAPKDYDGRAAVKRRKIAPIEEYMLRKHVSLEYIHEIATYLTNNFELTLTEDDDVPDIVPSLRRRFAG